MRECEYLSFRLGPDEYCIDIMSVREIRSWSVPTPLPHAPPHLRGVINLRGTVLPVLDLSLRLGMGPASGEARNVIIVVAQGSQMSGLLVDAVSDILSLMPDCLQPPPDLALYAEQKYVAALTLIDGRMVRILNLAAVLPETIAESM